MSWCKNCEDKPEKEVKVYNIRVMSTKKQAANKKKMATYAEIGETREQFCVSCGTTKGRIDRSHTISVNHRKDLEAVAENIQYRCRKCHTIHDSGDINKMMQLGDWNESLEYIRKTDSEMYQKIMNKMGNLTLDLNTIKPTI
jgi:uncharacterized protein (DUF3084 family)